MIDLLKNLTIRKFYIQKLLWDRDISFLTRTGWVRSFREKRCVDADGKPVPWLTYAFNQLLDQRLTKNLDLYEFGSGYSTLFFAERVASVDTMEYDAEWLDWVRTQVPDNVDVAHFPSDSPEYSQSILNKEKTYDVIVVDGRRRNDCVESSLQRLKPTGVIIYDDTHREKYQSGAALITGAGFKRLDFWGFANGNIDLKCTSLFYRADNCLGI